MEAYICLKLNIFFNVVLKNFDTKKYINILNLLNLRITCSKLSGLLQLVVHRGRGRKKHYAERNLISDHIWSITLLASEEKKHRVSGGGETERKRSEQILCGGKIRLALC